MAWTTPRTWVGGEIVTASLMNTYVRDNLSYLFATSSTYTPTLTATTTNPVINNGTITGLYYRIGFLVVFQMFFQMGSGTTVGSGTWLVSLPVTCDGSHQRVIGAARVVQYGIAEYKFISILYTTTTVFMDETGHYVSHNDPFAWAVNDGFSMQGWYWAAA